MISQQVWGDRGVAPNRYRDADEGPIGRLAM